MKIKKITGEDIKKIFGSCVTMNLETVADAINNLIDPVRLVGFMHITGFGANGEKIQVQDIAVTNHMLDGDGGTEALAKVLGLTYGIEEVTQVSLGSPPR